MLQILSCFYMIQKEYLECYMQGLIVSLCLELENFRRQFQVTCAQ